jgi:hypothetical protein
MRRILCAGVAAATLCAAAPRPAEAWGGGAIVAGTVVGLAAGTIVGSALARPYYAYPYYPYPYAYYPAPVYAPYPYYAPPPGYAVAYPPPAYSAPAPAAAAPAPSCRQGQFYNSLTGNCDSR